MEPKVGFSFNKILNTITQKVSKFLGLENKIHTSSFDSKADVGKTLKLSEEEQVAHNYDLYVGLDEKLRDAKKNLNNLCGYNAQTEFVKEDDGIGIKFYFNSATDKEKALEAFAKTDIDNPNKCTFDHSEITQDNDMDIYFVVSPEKSVELLQSLKYKEPQLSKILQAGAEEPPNPKHDNPYTSYVRPQKSPIAPE